MRLTKVVEKVTVFAIRDMLALISGRRCTRFMAWYYRRQGMRIVGMPNFISRGVWFDGTDYSLIELNEGCTISNHVLILTHDWALHTLVRGIGLNSERILGSLRPVRIGRFAFVGMGCTLLPGSEIGDCSIVGAGSVVRGKIPEYSIVVGNPAQSVGDVRNYICRNLQRLGEEKLLEQANLVFQATRGQS